MRGGGGETVCFRGKKLNNWNYKITRKREIWWANQANKGVQIKPPGVTLSETTGNKSLMK